jgi:hypothetical protein
MSFEYIPFAKGRVSFEKVVEAGERPPDLAFAIGS